MDAETFVDPNLSRSDLLVMQNLLQDVSSAKKTQPTRKSAVSSKSTEDNRSETSNGARADDQATIDALDAFNNPRHKEFEPTVMVSWDLNTLRIPSFLNKYLLQPYIALGKKAVRAETDVVMFTHLLLYFGTSVPSAIALYYYPFSWVHGVLHWLMQSYYTPTYTLMMHQHIHMNGVLSKKYSWFDQLFPYITNPLMGHSWNSYYYHHVKHHHIEGNGPNDLSSTLRYQRDSIIDFLHYVGRFMFFVWLELPLYFLRNNKRVLAAKAAFWDLGTYLAIYLVAQMNWKATLFVFMLPLFQLRIALMVGNWGQHALVDEVDPTSDFRSSITLIDVGSNRYCYNDGYHTSHHLNPRRHWRDHPSAFIQQKGRYSKEQALVFRNIDYFMLTMTILRKDYTHLAKCLLPIGDQIGMNLEEKANLLRTKTRRFTEEEIKKKFSL